jgi:hypothetical protein
MVWTATVDNEYSQEEMQKGLDNDRRDSCLRSATSHIVQSNRVQQKHATYHVASRMFPFIKITTSVT